VIVQTGQNVCVSKICFGLLEYIVLHEHFVSIRLIAS